MNIEEGESSLSSLKCQDNKWSDGRRGDGGCETVGDVKISNLCVHVFSLYVFLNEPSEHRSLSYCTVQSASWILVHHHFIHPLYPVPPWLSTYTPLCFTLPPSLHAETFLIVPVVWDLDRPFSYVTGPSFPPLLLSFPSPLPLLFTLSCTRALIV